MRNKHNHDVETVINYIRNMIYSGRLQSGDRLPSERKLAEDLSVSRSYVRIAIQKLEFHGVIKILPQSGSVIEQLSSDKMERVLSDMLQITKYDFASLVDVRLLLECEAIRLSALNRTDQDIVMMENALQDCERMFNTSQRVAKDYAYHQALVNGAHNPVISSLLLVITPDVLKYYQKYKVCSIPVESTIHEHRNLLEHIKNKDAEKAVQELKKHLAALCKTAKEYGNRL